MKSSTIIKRHLEQTQAIKRKIKRRARWIAAFPKSRLADYLRALIVEDNERLYAVGRVLSRSLKRRYKDLEEILAIEQPSKRKQKFQKEYEDLIEIMCLSNK